MARKSVRDRSARGYCSRSVAICLKRLGFPNKEAFQAVRKLGDICMKASFCIWLARNSISWNQGSCNLVPGSTSVPTPLLPKVTSPQQQQQHQQRKPTVDKSYSHPDPEPPTNSTPAKPTLAGLINKGNTCYANSILQALSVTPALWSQSASESSFVSPLAKSVLLTMSLLSKSTPVVDPSAFLRALQRKMSNARNNPFSINTQQDVPEILPHVLNELTWPSVIANNIITNKVTTTISCNSCLLSSSREESMSILPLPVSNNITGSIKAFLQPEYMSGNDRWMCPQCSSLQDSTRETVFTQCGDILIIQLKRFNCIQGRSVKNNKFVSCLAQGHDTLKVYSHPAEDISFTNQYKLTATINHSGTLAAGHYWAFIRDQGVNTWLKCDDRAVISVKPSDLDNSTVYVLIFAKI
ncbi:putative ubiquitin carboxyl-terminal hydrolase 50 [Hydractinia symbiolongicarpus]|uniref:putative ubiquitin carboxyl-terminal hydrolase 50 n=1 Tax=Hydractinia symbiolongicarpus TaxID=13093 RepID=UPI0025510F23|nr:putative ubiquitin carboxyl-terminal hydrolase 50 [Hydractinia symbiolongicarpus]